MLVIVIQGPHASFDAATASGLLPPRMREAFREAGSALVLRAFTSARGLCARLREIRRNEAELVLLDPGDLAPDDCRREAVALRGALDALPAPYIEIHDDRAGELEPRLQPQHLPMAVVVIRRDLARSYAISLAIALQCLARRRQALAA